MEEKVEKCVGDRIFQIFHFRFVPPVMWQEIPGTCQTGRTEVGPYRISLFAKNRKKIKFVRQNEKHEKIIKIL